MWIQRAVYRWIFEPLEREAIIANIAVKERIDYRAIIETACINSPAELLAVKQAYQARYKRSLEEDVASHTSGDLRKASSSHPTAPQPGAILCLYPAY